MSYHQNQKIQREQPFKFEAQLVGTQSSKDSTQGSDIIFLKQIESKEYFGKPSEKIDPYVLKHSGYIGNKINPLNRYKCIKWIQFECQRQKYSRQILALSCYYLDLFLSKSQKVYQNELQDLVLASVMIAVKIQGGSFPKLGQVSSKDKILYLETKICLKLNYFLYPKTYLIYLEQYTSMWNKFIISFDKQSGDRFYSQTSQEKSLRIKQIYQKMECINMFSQSLKYDLSQLSFNLIFIETMKNEQNNPQIKDCFKMKENSQDMKKIKQWIEQIYLDLKDQKNIFSKFLLFQDNKIILPSLRVEIGKYLLPFVLLQSDNEYNRCPYNRFIQTLSPIAIREMDQYVRRVYGKRPQ